jgi:Holliday junction DNA helicase RuvB
MKDFTEYLDLFLCLLPYKNTKTPKKLPVEYQVNLIENPAEQKIILQEPNINTTIIPNYPADDKVRVFRFSPKYLTQYIGQTEAKNIIKIIMEKIKNNVLSHLIIDGIQGHGKTTLIRILSNEINANLIETIGSQIDTDTLAFYLKQINTTDKHSIFFIDEIDTMKPRYIKLLNPILEYFKINDKNIKPFTFACATINKAFLLQKTPDFLDRIPHHIKLTRYSTDEIQTILRQYSNQINKEIEPNIIEIISQNCKFNPRRSISLLEDYLILNDVNEVLKNHQIVKDGLTIKDIEILKVLSTLNRPIGSNALAMKVKLLEKEYLIEYEPYLIEMGYIDRVPSRIITDKGRHLLMEIENGL